MTQATLDERGQGFADEAQRGAHVIARLRQALGADIVKDGTDGDFARHVSDFTNVMPADIPLPGIAYPRTTEQVSQIMAICNEERWPVVPQGGLTSLCAGGLADRPCLLLSLERMRGIEELDEAGRTMTVLAGTVLETVQRAADEAAFCFRSILADAERRRSAVMRPPMPAATACCAMA
ncbi:FAD/FMN-containing dehydrogenase [Sphingobium sp. B1D7B]|nr:FAD/FMN-containing dehydrogenase [Sphingobium sp. B1D7B]